MLSPPAQTSNRDTDEAERLVCEQFAVIETANLALADANVTADYVNHRSAHEPLAARGRGPAALHATANWLHDAFSQLRFEVDNVALVGDVAIAWVTMHGVHTGSFVVHDSPDGAVTEAFPPTGRAFATRQVHWFRIEGGAVAEHDAVRDDLDLAKQAGWIPPSPAYIVRMRIARRRALRAARPSVTQRGSAQLADIVVDVAVILAWTVKLLAWFLTTGCTASGWAALGVPQPMPWPPRPRLALWHRAHRRLHAEIRDVLSQPRD